MSARTLDTVPIRERFRYWRRSRPFWGGVTAIVAGVEMYALTAVPFSLMVIQGIAGVSALLIMILMVVLALVSWYQPHLRLVTGLIIVILALASILLTNLGGFLIGMLLGVHSGASIAAWRPREAHDDPGALGGSADPPTPADDATSPPDRPRGPDRALGPGLGIVLALLALALVPTPRAVAATTTAPRVSAPAARSNLFCDLFPWLCPAPTPSPPPSPSPSPSPSPPGGIGLPAVPGVTAPNAPAGSVTASACDKAQMPTRPTLGSSGARKAASILKACVDSQKAGALTVSTKASGGGPTVVSSVPAHLVAPKETMTGLGYDGVVTVQTDAGPKRALKFHADTVTIQGIRQTVAYPGATMLLSGSTDLVLSGRVQLYVFSQRGNVFGLLPLTLDPDNPPPLVIPYMVFTDVDSQVAYQEADKLSLPGGSIKVS